MSDKLVREIVEPVNEGSAYDIKLGDFVQVDNSTLTISNVKVYVFVTGNYVPPKYVNNRDGSNNTGLVLQDNTVTFHLSAADNAIILPDKPNYYERHTVLFEIFYNSGADKFYVEFELKVRNLSINGQP